MAITVLKADGEREQFESEKLVSSLMKSGASEQISKRIAAHVESELINEMSTTDIYRHAFELLKQEHRPLAARYSLRRALIGFGPTGFPFEEYVAQIFKNQGYSVENDKIIHGKCVGHEVDLIAYTNEKLLIGEIKFHNELGYKTDLKVALYVKARTDDIKNAPVFIGGKSRMLDEGWLITNTKFTQTAIAYGQCVGLNLIGWNYPKEASLERLIEDQMLHPVSCLTTLSSSQKQQLYKQGVVLCKSLKDEPGLLKTIGLSGSKLDAVSEEIQAIC